MRRDVVTIVLSMMGVGTISLFISLVGLATVGGAQ